MATRALLRHQEPRNSLGKSKCDLHGKTRASENCNPTKATPITSLVHESEGLSPCAVRDQL